MCTVCEILKSIDSYSVEYLSWLTAIVGGIITITTIVFTHYNERSIEKSNDFVDEIRTLLNENKENKEIIPFNELGKKFNKITESLSNNNVYKITLNFFEIILYVLIVLWFFGSLGYALNSDTWPEKIVIMVSSIILISVFMFIPEVVKKLNRNNILLVTKKNECSLNEALNFFQYNNILTKNDIIVNLISPKMRISINNNEQIILEFNQGLSIIDYTIIFRLVKTNEVSYICLNNNTAHLSVKYSIDQSPGTTFRGLFDIIKTSSTTRGEVFIYENSTADKKVFKLSNIHNEDGEIILSIKESQTITNRTVDKMFEKQTSLIKISRSSPNGDIEYLIKKID